MADANLSRVRAVTLLRLIMPEAEVLKACEQARGAVVLSPGEIFTRVVGTAPTAEELPIVTAYLEDLVAEGSLVRSSLALYGRRWRPR
jgi:hypothetical protein